MVSHNSILITPLINSVLIGLQSGNVNICHITEEVKQALKEFRFRKAQNTAALICTF